MPTPRLRYRLQSIAKHSCTRCKSKPEVRFKIGHRPGWYCLECVRSIAESQGWTPKINMERIRAKMREAVAGSRA